MLFNWEISGSIKTATFKIRLLLATRFCNITCMLSCLRLLSLMTFARKTRSSFSELIFSAILRLCSDVQSRWPLYYRARSNYLVRQQLVRRLNQLANLIIWLDPKYIKFGTWKVRRLNFLIWGIWLDRSPDLSKQDIVPEHFPWGCLLGLWLFPEQTPACKAGKGLLIGVGPKSHPESPRAPN